MKFITYSMFDVAKMAEVTQASDKVANTPGQKILAKYACQGMPFPGFFLPNTMIVITTHEVESNEALTAYAYPVMLAGATLWAVPVLEFPVGGAAATDKKYRK